MVDYEEYQAAARRAALRERWAQDAELCEWHGCAEFMCFYGYAARFCAAEACPYLKRGEPVPVRTTEAG